jgi:serine phosphatase RsbU (regulator of sigma subunit)
MVDPRLKAVANKIRKEEELVKSMRSARARQLSMLPNMPHVPGFDFHSLYLPAANVSGDFYDIIELGDGRFGLTIGDITGHGLEAAILMGMAKKAISIYARQNDCPRAVLIAANADLSRDLDDSTFITVSYGILDTKSRIFRGVRAGHNPALVVNSAREPRLFEIKPTGMVLGIDRTGRNFNNLCQISEVSLQPGDLLFQYTDGLVEAPNSENEDFSDERFQALLMEHADQPVRVLIDLIEQAWREHIGRRQQEDDVTFMAVKVL